MIKKYIHLYYEIFNFSIIPLKYGDKAPNVFAWRKYQKKRACAKELKEWIEKGKFGGIGIVCGDVSKLAVIDIDNKKVANDLKIDFRKIYDSGALVVKTGKGWHIYIRTNQSLQTEMLPQLGIELRANGAYVVAPPSKHPNNGVYKFYKTPNSMHLFDEWDGGKVSHWHGFLRPQNVQAIWQDFKQRLYALYPQYKPKNTNLRRLLLGDFENAFLETPPCIEEIGKGVSRGMRNNACFALASYYMQQGKGMSEIESILDKWNGLNNPPLPKREIRLAIKSCFLGQKKVGCGWMKNRLGMGYLCPSCVLRR